MAVGHTPPPGLAPQDAAALRVYQSNLLSLISHELRTPLMGILNSLGMMEEGAEAGGISREELVTMAKRNAHRLHRTLSALLDLAQVESGIFHARLREVELPRLVHVQLAENATELHDQKLKVELEEVIGQTVPVLADPQRLGRALELCLQVLLARAEPGSEVQVRISSARVVFDFRIVAGTESLWENAWSQAVAGYEAGVVSPSSAFAGTLKSEQEFLSRMEEGLGSEFMLVHEIMRLHQGKFTEKHQGQDVSLVIELPELSSDEGLHAVLASRTGNSHSALDSVALGLVQVPDGVSVDAFRAQVKKGLFRSSDAAYSLPSRKRVALILDDCKPEDAPRLLARLEKSMGKTLAFGIAACPSEGMDPKLLLELAEKRLKKAIEAL